MGSIPFIVRQATVIDADAIAEVHMASIHSIGATRYPQNIIEEWGSPRDGSRYVKAMERGETFFVAVYDGIEKGPHLGGFSCHAIKEGKHRTAIYVHPRATRSGVGTALFKAAEKVARDKGAAEIYVDASLPAVEFYLANGFEKLSEGEHRLASGTPMACVFMRKKLN